MEDTVLVQRAQQGDQHAFAQLVEQYQTPVYNLAYRMLGNPNDAEDAAQETFLRAYTQLPSFRRDEKFATWLLAIDAHYCIDRLRRRRRFQWLSMDDEQLEQTLPSDLGIPEDELFRHEDERAVVELLDRLAPSSRLAVVLRYWYDQSIEEIARTTGDSVSAVKVKLHRARHALARAWTNTQATHVPLLRAVGGQR